MLRQVGPFLLTLDVCLLPLNVFTTEGALRPAVCVKLCSPNFTNSSTEGLINLSTVTINLSLWSIAILVFHLVKKYFAFCGGRSPLPYLQEPTCRPFLEPNESIPYHQTLSFKIHFNNINSSLHTSINWSLPLKFSS